jgi:hypothetical protein
VRLSVGPAEQNMSTPPAPQHSSAYESGMFSKTGTDAD